jgi:hypothetical protein
MASFAEIVAESFHSEVKLIWKLTGTNQAIATFTVSAVMVEVSFEEREQNGPWHVAFNVVKGDISARPHLAFRIFNGVFQAVREFVETREPLVLVFISKDEDLAAIYETYLRREKAKLAELGYAVEGPFRVDLYTQFTLRRVKPSQWNG